MAATRMEFGYLMPTRGVILGGQRPPQVDSLYDCGARAEDLGYESLWFGDSIITKPRLDPFTTMAAVAMRVRSAKLGTAVVLSGLRNPLLLAHQVASLDLIAEGRLILGVGVGRGGPAFEQESAGCGVPFRQKPGRMEEGLELLRMFWSQEKVTYKGRYFAYDGLSLEPQPYTEGGPPIWVSSNLVERGLKRVAQHGDAWITNVTTPAAFQECRAKIIDYGSALGKDLSNITSCLYMTMNVNPNASAAREEGSSFLENYYHKSIEDLQKDLVMILGDPETCLKRLDEFMALGLTSMIVRFASADQIGQMEFFAKEVLAKFS